MIDFRKSKFLLSAADVLSCPKDGRKEIALFGRSNVGKSTLVNLLLGQALAYSSKRAGKTKTLNYFLVDSSFYLVDAPGYGYTDYGNKLDEFFAGFMEPYLTSGRLSGALLLLDVRRGLGEDDASMLELLVNEAVPHAIVFTKSDRATQREKAVALKSLDGRTGAPTIFLPDRRGAEGIRRLVASFL